MLSLRPGLNQKWDIGMAGQPAPIINMSKQPVGTGIVQLTPLRQAGLIEQDTDQIGKSEKMETLDIGSGPGG